jgi:hypothetical protein
VKNQMRLMNLRDLNIVGHIMCGSVSHVLSIYCAFNFVLISDVHCRLFTGALDMPSVVCIYYASNARYHVAVENGCSMCFWRNLIFIEGR